MADGLKAAAVAHQPHVIGVAPAGDGGKLVRVQHGAGGVAGAGDDQALRARVELFQHPDRWLKPGVRPGLQHHRDHPQRGEDIYIRRIERRRHRHAVAGIERSEEGQRKCARRPHRHRDARARHVLAIPVPVMAAQAIAQGRNPEGFRVAHRPTLAQRRHCRRHGAGRCTGAGLADFHADDMRRTHRQSCLPGVRRRDDVHDDEGRGEGAFADLDPGHHRPPAINCCPWRGRRRADRWPRRKFSHCRANNRCTRSHWRARAPVPRSPSGAGCARC